MVTLASLGILPPPYPDLDPSANGDDEHKQNWGLRSVMLALGGFRRLHLLYLWQLSRRPRSGSNWAPPMIRSGVAGGGRSSSNDGDFWSSSKLDVWQWS
ncbi:hypothetical protein Q3G72_034887 [Acer saccharum]|nr:hypothetical protein Q3G72_034887 [Acer saccharum]